MGEGDEGLQDENDRLARHRLGASHDQEVIRVVAWTASRHLISGAQARRDLRRGRDVHVFLNGVDLARLEHEIWAHGAEGPHDIRDWKRYWLTLDWQIGERLQLGRPAVALYVAEIKARIQDGRWEFHLVPRASKAKEVLR